MKKHTDEEKTGVNLTRRSFLRRLWLVLGFVALAEFVGVGVAFLRPRRPKVGRAKTGGIVTAGAADSFEPGSVRAFREGRFYLARLSDGGFLALSRTCTHLGCTVPWVAEEEAFQCPCHSSSFDIRGDVVEPPAPRALDLYPVSIENGIVKVDTSEAKKRKRFDPSQVTYP
jgi:cytochrome b6-f complex iron-sulfur subunit